MNERVTVEADWARLGELLQRYAANLGELAYAIRAGDLGDVVHHLSGGAAVPADQWGRVLAEHLQGGLTPITVLCGKVWGEETQLVGQQRQARAVHSRFQAVQQERERRRAEAALIYRVEAQEEAAPLPPRLGARVVERTLHGTGLVEVTGRGDG